MTLASDQLRSIIDRILRLKEEQDALGDDIKEIYFEAKSNGYDKPTLGKAVSTIRARRKKGETAAAEADALLDMYLSAYDGMTSATHAHAHASARTNPDMDHETSPVGHSAPDANGRIVTAPAERAAEESPAISSSTATGDAHVTTPTNRTPETGGGSKRTAPADLPAWAAPPIPDYLVRAG